MSGLLLDLRQALGLWKPFSEPDPLLTRGDRVLVAVSGGPDSLTLLHALHTLRDEIGLAGLSAAHFHHGLRGREADDDAVFTQEFCAARDIPCVVAFGDIKSEAARAHLSIQQAARAARYDFLARTAQACGANKVATGHTEDDQVETILLNILRGTGLHGLRGIPARRGIFVRPLIHITRAQVKDYCVAYALTPRSDQSNKDPSHYMRNRIRLELMPLLKQQYSPRAHGALLRLSEIATADADFLQAHAQEMLCAVTLAESDPPRLTLSRDALRMLHPGLLPHVLRAAIVQVRGTADGMTHAHLAQIAQALSLPEKRRWGMSTPAPRCRVNVHANSVMIMPADIATSAECKAFSTPLTLGDTIELPASRWWVQASLAGTEQMPTSGECQANFDAAQVHLPTLCVRTWQAGDRIAPRGLDGHTRKLQDIFTDAKVPRAERAHVPVIADRNELLWVAGLAVAQRAQATVFSRQILRVRAYLLPFLNTESDAGKNA